MDFAYTTKGNLIHFDTKLEAINKINEILNELEINPGLMITEHQKNSIRRRE